MPKPDPERELMTAHMAATRAAFQVLVHCLEENEALHHGQFPEALRVYMEMTKAREGNEVELALLHELRVAMMD